MLPTPDAAALVALDTADVAPFMPLVSQLCWAGGVAGFFFWAFAWGRGFFWVGGLYVAVVVVGFFCAAVVTGFFAAGVMGFLAVVEATGALRTGVVVGFLGVLPGMAFLVPMGWATIVMVLSWLCFEVWFSRLDVISVRSRLKVWFE